MGSVAALHTEIDNPLDLIAGSQLLAEAGAPTAGLALAGHQSGAGTRV